MKQPRVIPRRAERLAISRLLVDLARAFHKRSFSDAHKGKSFGSEIEIVFVACCVAIGDFEGRPMSASDVAVYIDMPRATVQRKLDELVGRNLVVRHSHKYCLSPFAIANGEAFVGIANKLIVKAQPTT